MRIFVDFFDNPKIIGIIRAIYDCNLFDSAKQPLFSLLAKNDVDIVFLHNYTNNISMEHIKLAKHDFPNTKFILLNAGKNVDKDMFDAVIDLLNPRADLFLPYLADDMGYGGGIFNERYATDFVFFTDSLVANDNNIIDTINYISELYGMKQYGRVNTKSPYYLGLPHTNEYKHIIASSRFVVMLEKSMYQNVLLNNKQPILFNTIEDFKNINFEEYNVNEEVSETYRQYINRVLKGL